MLIDNIQVVFFHKIETDIVLQISDKLSMLKSRYNAQVKILNIPHNAPPDAPRVVAAFQEFVIQYALDRVTVVYNIENKNITDLKNVLMTVRDKVLQFEKLLAVRELGYNWMGVVVPVQYPNSDINSFVTTMEKVTKVVFRPSIIPNGLVNFNMQIGRSENGLYKNISLGIFETRNIEIHNKLPSNEYFVVNAEDYPVTQKGIQIIIDVNNKPGNSKGIPSDFNIIINAIEEVLSELISQINFEDKLL